jgi:hypothetical protein
VGCQTREVGEKHLLLLLKKDEANRGSEDNENYRPLKQDADFSATMEGEIDEDDSSNEGEEEW